MKNTNNTAAKTTTRNLSETEIASTLRTLAQSKQNAKRGEELARIAKEHLSLETLETRNSDSLDFKDTAVWCIKDALIAAYEAGRKAAK